MNLLVIGCGMLVLVIGAKLRRLKSVLLMGVGVVLILWGALQ